MFNRNILLFSLICGVFLIYIQAKVLEPAENKFVNKTSNSTELKVVENRLAIDLNQGKGHKHKRKKLLKQLYPVFLALLFAKTVVVPLVLKLLIAATSSAFVMSKIAMVTSALLGLSWVLGATREKPKLQIVQYPAASGSKKAYGGWNVKEKYSPHYESSYNDWTSQGYGGDDIYDKNVFL